MNPDTATLQECCLALSDFIRTGWRDGYLGGEHPFTEAELMIVCPVKPTLDDIRKALPPGWDWERISFTGTVSVYVSKFDPYQRVISDGILEDLARARAAVKCWMIVKGEA